MERTYPLRQKLPAEVLVGGNAVWSRYRQYPVFGLRWLLGRSLLFCGVIAVVAAFIGMGTGVVAQDVGLGLNQFLDPGFHRLGRSAIAFCGSDP